MVCDMSTIEAWRRTPPGAEAWALDAQVTHVPVTIQPTREVGLAQESTR